MLRAPRRRRVSTGHAVNPRSFGGLQILLVVSLALLMIASFTATWVETVKKSGSGGPSLPKQRKSPKPSILRTCWTCSRASCRTSMPRASSAMSGGIVSTVSGLVSKLQGEIHDGFRWTDARFDDLQERVALKGRRRKSRWKSGLCSQGSQWLKLPPLPLIDGSLRTLTGSPSQVCSKYDSLNQYRWTKWRRWFARCLARSSSGARPCRFEASRWTGSSEFSSWAKKGWRPRGLPNSWRCRER
jgi:hypothetical protein